MEYIIYYDGMKVLELQGVVTIHGIGDEYSILGEQEEPIACVPKTHMLVLKSAVKNDLQEVPK